MKIVIGIPFLYPAISYGGAARAAYYVARGLHELGHEVTVLTSDVWDDRSRYKKTGVEEGFNVVRVRNLSNSAAYYLQFYTPLGLVKEAEKYIHTADIVHLHTFRNLHNDVIARIAARHKVPFVVTGNGTIPYVDRFFFFKRVYDALLGNWQLRFASGFIAVSEHEKRTLVDFGIQETRIRVIPNPFEPRRVNHHSNGFRSKFGLSEHQYVLFLGRITARKGVDHLIRAFSRIPNGVKLVIAGNIISGKGRLKNLIRSENLGSRIVWTGLLNDEEKYDALANAAVTVYPSIDEVFGLVPLESLDAGTPVIVCDDGGCGEIINRIGGGDLVRWADSEHLAAVINKRLESGKDRLEIAAAREKIFREFNSQTIAESTVEFYKYSITANGKT